jgi:hypothetical protein
MQTVVALALAALYVGLTLAWAGVHPRSGFIWWFFAPAIMTFVTGLVGHLISGVLPIPWEGGREYALPPRRVHLSWRTAVRIPALLPMCLVPYYMAWILHLHCDVRWIAGIGGLVVATAATIVVRKRARELRLLRRGSVAMGVVLGRSGSEWPEDASYGFVTTEGASVRGSGNDLGYGVAAGSSVPVFYDAGNPSDHVVATACWFEVMGQ